METEKICIFCKKFDRHSPGSVTYKVWQNSCYGPPPPPVKCATWKGKRLCSMQDEIVDMKPERIKCQVPKEFESLFDESR